MCIVPRTTCRAYGAQKERQGKGRVPQQDLESLVFKSDGRIAFCSDASLRKCDGDDDVADPIAIENR